MIELSTAALPEDLVDNPGDRFHAPAPPQRPFMVLIDTREPALEKGNDESAICRPRYYRRASKGTAGAYVLAPSRRATLETGDYSLDGYEDVIAFERKTLPDLIGTLMGGRLDSVGELQERKKNFREELERMRAMPPGSFRAVVVEASRDDIECELYKVPADARVEFALAEACLKKYAGTKAEGAIACESCPGYRWPGERCFLCCARPPGKLRFDGVSPLSLLRFCESLERDYLVPFVWAGSREGCERYIGGQLRDIWEQARGEGEAFRKGCARGVGGFRPWIAAHTGEVA